VKENEVSGNINWNNDVLVRKRCNECEDNHCKEEETNKKRVETTLASGGSRVDNYSDLCVPCKMDVILDRQRVTNQQLEMELVLVARHDKG